jgi:hypothetical protein
MVFGMCATRVIGLVVNFAKDVVSVRTQMNSPGSAGARMEEVTSDESKKTL